ncbi:MAG: tyrosine-type recombinase/integrase [Bacillota bacterium]|jgi:integrase
MAKYLRKTFTVTLMDGSSKRIEVKAKTPKELEEKYLKKKLEYEMGLITVNSNTPFKKWVETWLETYKKQDVSEGTYKEINYIITRYFVNSLGALKMSDIKPVHLKNCLNAMEGMSESYIKRAYIYIKDIMKKAVINDLITKDPSIDLHPPAGTKGEKRALTDDEIEIFKQAMLVHHRGPFFGAMLAGGLRPQEARALTWQNVFIDKGEFKVCQAIEARSRNKIKEPKSKAGFRIVPIFDWYIPILKRIPKTNSIFVFPNDKGQPLDHNRVWRGWRSFLRQMDIIAGAKLKQNKIIVHAIAQDLTPHCLRHTYATKMAEAGVDMKTLQYIMGHSDIRMTANVYTHITDNMLAEAKEKMKNKPENNEQETYN